MEQTGAKLKFNGLKVPDFTLLHGIKFVDELKKTAGFFSKKFVAPDAEGQMTVETAAEKLQESCENIKKHLKPSKAPASESECSNSVL